MIVKSLAKMYHDQFYHRVNPNHPIRHVHNNLANHSTPDYVVHLSPEALRLHREHVAKSANPGAVC